MILCEKLAVIVSLFKKYEIGFCGTNLLLQKSGLYEYKLNKLPETVLLWEDL
jgi:hypothetical protein